MRIAKVAITNVAVWLLAWSPYAFIALIGQFGGLSILTPLTTQLPSFMAKTASMFNPIIYVLSHPKFVLPITRYQKYYLCQNMFNETPRFREALTTEVPCMGISEVSKAGKDDSKTTTEAA